MLGLSWTEWAGVTAVGLALGYAGKAVANAQETPAAHQTAMLLTGAGLYVAGVGIGVAWKGGESEQKFITAEEI